MSEIIRRPNFAGGGITDDEKAQMDLIAQEWIGIAFRNTPIDADKIAPAIKGLYKAADLAEPHVVIAPSPMAMVFIYGAASYILKQSKKLPPKPTGAGHNHIERGVLQAIYGPEAFPGRLYDGIDTPRVALEAATAAAKAILRAKSFDKTKKDVLKEARDWSSVYQGGNMWAWWEGYLCAGRDVLKLELEVYEKYRFWEQSAREGGFRCMHEHFCVVSDFPEFIKIDNDNRPHAETGASHKWRDGWSLYHWHGVAVPSEWMANPEELTAATAITWDNIEQRRAACEILGWDAILKQLDAVSLDRDNDPMVGELLEVDIPDIGKEKFLRVLCGTGRTFALPVPPEMQTALEANAWTFGMDKDQFTIPEVRT